MTLLCISLGLAPAFMMRFWNIGAEGQILVGGIATAGCMIYLGDKLPTPLLFVVMLVACLAAGALWGFIPAFFKASATMVSASTTVGTPKAITGMPKVPRFNALRALQAPAPGTIPVSET